jgi:hypothetical protein
VPLVINVDDFVNQDTQETQGSDFTESQEAAVMKLSNVSLSVWSGTVRTQIMCPTCMQNPACTHHRCRVLVCAHAFPNRG